MSLSGIRYISPSIFAIDLIIFWISSFPFFLEILKVTIGFLSSFPLKNDKKNEINDLGKVTYEMLREDNLDEEILNLKFESIMEIEKQIKDKEEQKENIEKEEIAEKTEEAQEFEETGEVESDQIFCPNCGEKNSSDAKFCKNCGTKLND